MKILATILLLSSLSSYASFQGTWKGNVEVIMADKRCDEAEVTISIIETEEIFQLAQVDILCDHTRTGTLLNEFNRSGEELYFYGMNVGTLTQNRFDVLMDFKDGMVLTYHGELVDGNLVFEHVYSDTDDPEFNLEVRGVFHR